MRADPCSCDVIQEKSGDQCNYRHYRQRYPDSWESGGRDFSFSFHWNGC
jgi:hypothetical protein